MPNAGIIALYLTIISGCNYKLSSAKHSEGRIQATAEYPGYTDTTFTKLAFNITSHSQKWYLGGYVIEEKFKTEVKTENGKTSENRLITGYVFMDFKKERAAEYATLSDTAKPLQTFALHDTVKLADGNYHWGANHNSDSQPQRVDLLSDTIIDNILYKRAARHYSQDIKNKPKHVVQILYFRPDKSEEIARVYFWQDSLTRSLQAPIVWIEERLSIDSPLVLSKVSLQFLSDTLTLQERNVFKAWKKNQEEKP